MNQREAKLSHETLIRLLDYDPETGVFIASRPTTEFPIYERQLTYRMCAMSK